MKTKHQIEVHLTNQGYVKCGSRWLRDAYSWCEEATIVRMSSHYTFSTDTVKDQAEARAALAQARGEA